LTPKVRSLIFICAFLVLMALTLSTSMQPSTAESQNVMPRFGGNTVFQSTVSNATSSATNRTGPFDFIFAPIVASVKTALAPYIGQPPRMPLSTLFTIGMAVVISLASATTGKVLVDYDMVRQNMREFQAYQRELNKARKEKDEQGLSKLMKKQQAMTKLQARASMEQMKVTAVTFVPFLLLWYLMSAVLGGVMVAQAPFPLPFLGTRLIFWQWYFLCNFAMSLPMYKIFGIGMSDN
jgi:uncharacterized membrane protein (DUF106 family)